jgi:acyl-CoA thioester hydrolase
MSVAHRAELRVRYSETDQMGVVYHANYLVWCEIGRTELIRQLGFPYAEMEKAGVILAVAEASVRYHASARYDDLILVDTEIEEVRSRAIIFRYVISRRRPDGIDERLATARTVLVAIDPGGQPRTMPPEVRNLFDDA